MKSANRHTAERRWGTGRWSYCRSIAAFLATVVGCSQPLAPPVRSSEPIGVQLMRAEPVFVGTPFRVLLDFESQTDMAFIKDAGAAKIDREVAHTGAASLQVPGG